MDDLELSLRLKRTLREAVERVQQIESSCEPLALENQRLREIILLDATARGEPLRTRDVDEATGKTGLQEAMEPENQA